MHVRQVSDRMSQATCCTLWPRSRPRPWPLASFLASSANKPQLRQINHRPAPSRPTPTDISSPGCALTVLVGSEDLLDESLKFIPHERYIF